MNKLREKKLAILLITIFILLTFAVAVPVFATPEVWVDDDAEPEWYEELNHYKTIQEGVDAVAKGGTVYVAGGEYYTASIHKSLTLLGAQADIPIVDGERAGEESIIRGVGTSGYPSSWCVVRIQYSDVVVNGFTIENGKRGIAIQGVKPDGISNIRISYNYLEGSGRAGIFRDDAASGVTIDHNYIAFNPTGISTRGGSTTITDNTFYGNGRGIDFHHGDPSSMYFTDYDQPNYPTIISDNTFTKDAISIELSLRGHQPIAITSNEITEARITAIVTDGWGDLVNPAIHYNNIWDNAFGMDNKVEEINLDATLNWWGHASGPSGDYGRVNKAGKVIGKGDSVSDNVNWDPWLPQPVDHTPHHPVPPGLE